MILDVQISESQKRWDEATKNMKQVFDSSALEALQKNNQLFLDLATQTFSKNEQFLGLMLNPLKENLNKHQDLTRELKESTKEIFGRLSSSIEDLKSSQESLKKETTSLVSALKAPKIRGRWGEIGLKRLVEFSGMSKYCDFVEQESKDTEDGRLRPDMIISLPGERRVIVDSKVPLNTYLESIETDDETKKKELLKKHSQNVRTHMNALSDKQYWAEFAQSADFVVLYIEVEPAFGAALSLDPYIITDALNKKIVFATPTTLLTLLRTIAYTWKQQSVTQNAIEIYKTGQELYDRISVFVEHLNGVGRGLRSAIDSYNNAVGSLESRVLVSTKKLKELGATTEKRGIKEPEQIAIAPKETHFTPTSYTNV
jgi:DNA recombination protein RmuC